MCSSSNNIYKYICIRIILSFNIDGLSAAGLRVILQPTNKDGRPDGFLRVLWGTKDPTNKIWMNSEVLYTYNKEHQVWLYCTCVACIYCCDNNNVLV